MDANAAAEVPSKKKAKKKIQLSNSMITLILVVAGVGILAFSYSYLKPQLEDKNAELQAVNDDLSSQLERVEELEANQISYSEQSAAFSEQTAEIIDEFPPMVKEEDVLVYAREQEQDSDGTTDIYTVSIGSGNLLYASGVSAEDGTVDGTAAATDDTTTDTATDTTTDTSTDTTADTTTTDTSSSSDSGYDLGILEESDVVLPNYQLFAVPTSWDFSSTYEDMKVMIENILTNPYVRNLRSFSLSYDGGGELIVGTLDLNMYYLAGTDKVYEEPDTGVTVRGKDNIYETIGSPDYDSIKVKSSTRKDKDSESDSESDSETDSETVYELED
jgi:hypothetical protein